MNALIIRRRQLAIASFLVGLSMLFALWVATPVFAAATPAPGDSIPAGVLPVATDPVSLNDAYSALNQGQRSFGDAMNAIHVLRTGKVAGIDLTAEQLDALKDQGFAGLYNARERYLDALEILDVTAAQLDAWELTHTQPVPCFSGTGVGC